MSSSTHLYSRLLLTGAAGGLGCVLRPRLKTRCDVLRLSDLDGLGEAAAGEEVMPAALQDRPAVLNLLQGVDAVIHLGGISTEQPFDDILQANIVGAYNLYEAARQQGTRRIVLASSNHVTGFYRQDEVVNPSMPVRPDGYHPLRSLMVALDGPADRVTVRPANERSVTCPGIDGPANLAWAALDALQAEVNAAESD